MRFKKTGNARATETCSASRDGATLATSCRHQPRGAQRNHRTCVLPCQIRSLLALAVLTFVPLVPQPVCAEPVALPGRWQLDEAASSNPEEELKGIRDSKRRHRPEAPQTAGKGPGSATQQRYWQTANAGEEWRHSRELAHAGPVQRLLESENMEIVVQEAGYTFIYADGFEREVRPNAAGRVFTASGEELVESEIGHTLAYWKDDVLVLETRIESGGKLIERLKTRDGGNTLELRIKIDRRDWKWIAELDRVYDRVPAGAP